MPVKKPLLTLSILCLVGMPFFVQATPVVRASSTNNTWSRAMSLGRNPTSAALYGRLSGTGDARYYIFTISRPGKMTVVVETTPDTPRLEPRIVVYEPEIYTVGPELPMLQPPKTLAAVYPANARTTHVEGPLRTKVAMRVNQSIDLPTAGKYYLAVYNAGKDTGAYRLTLSTTGQADWTPMMRFRSWWLTNVWLGPQFGALTIPVLVGLAAVIAWLVISQIPLAVPARSRSTRKRTVSHVKIRR